MNERIKELAEQAGLPTYNPEGVPTKLEKFAKLIIKECSRVAKLEVGTDKVYDAIEKHFGVEE